MNCACTQSHSVQSVLPKSDDVFDRWDGENPTIRNMIWSDGSALHIAPSAEVTINGEKSNLDQLRKGMRVQLFTKNMTVVKVVARSHD
jgi:hypothetical protein